MELSFDDASIDAGEKFVNKYMSPGNHKVKVIEVVKGLSAQKGSPFVRITVENEAKETCSNEYYLNGGAWNISKSSILTVVTAALNTDEAAAKSKLDGLTSENIDSKLSSLLVGKHLAMTISGEWVNPSDTSKKPFVKSVFGRSGAGYFFALPLNRFNELNSKVYIKGEAISVSETQQSMSNDLGW